MKNLSPWDIFFGLLVLVAAAFIIYGLRTDCPDTEGYVNCSQVNK